MLIFILFVFEVELQVNFQVQSLLRMMTQKTGGRDPRREKHHNQHHTETKAMQNTDSIELVT